MSEHFNGLTPAEAEQLALMMEECGEVIQAAAKVLRHGWESVNPILAAHNKASPTNRESLQKEMGQLWFTMDLITERSLSPVAVATAFQSKRDTIWQWLHHNQRSHP